MAQSAARKHEPESPPNEAELNGDRELSVEDWLGQNRHKCYLPSGGYVWIRIPDLADLLLDEALPEHLERAAVRKLVREFEDLEEKDIEEASAAVEAAPDGEAADDARKRLEALMEAQAKATRGAAELQNRLVLRMVEQPKLTREQLAMLPPADRELLADIAMRGGGVDARGNLIGSHGIDARGNQMGVADLAGLEPFRVEPDSPPSRPSRKAPKRSVPKSRKSKV